MNKKGFTLIELLAVFVILGVLLGVTIPNIIGITEANRIQTYADDSKKFKNSVEYAFRGDDTIILPSEENDCIIANLKYISGAEFDKPPYGGKYLMDDSYVVMKLVKEKDGSGSATKYFTYKYYVQLVEEFTQGDGSKGYRGVRLKDYQKLEGDKYHDEISEDVSLNGFAVGLGDYRDQPDETAISNYLTKLVTKTADGGTPITLEGTTAPLCNKIVKVYFTK